MNREAYLRAVGGRVYPTLRTAGFRGSGATLRRVREPVVHVFNVQGSTGADRCYVNLGVHLTVLAGPGGDATDPAGIRVPGCAFRQRLEPDRSSFPGDTHGAWPYGDTAAAADASVRLVEAAVVREALPFFDRFASFPGDFQRFVDAVDEARTHPGLLAGHAELALALGDLERCGTFVREALRTCPDRATGLRARLEGLSARAARDA